MVCTIEERGNSFGKICKRGKSRSGAGCITRCITEPDRLGRLRRGGVLLYCMNNNERRKIEAKSFGALLFLLSQSAVFKLAPNIYMRYSTGQTCAAGNLDFTQRIYPINSI